MADSALPEPLRNALTWSESGTGSFDSTDGWRIRPISGVNGAMFGLWWGEVAGDPMEQFFKSEEAKGMAQRLQDVRDGLDEADDMRARADLLGWLIWNSQPADVAGYEKFSHPVDDERFLVYRQSSVARGTARNAAKFVWWTLGSGEFPGPVPDRVPTLDDVRDNTKAAVWRSFTAREELLSEIGDLRGVLKKIRTQCQGVIESAKSRLEKRAEQAQITMDILDEAGADR
jgi:hypothetical protein